MKTNDTAKEYWDKVEWVPSEEGYYECNVYHHRHQTYEAALNCLYSN